MTILPSFLSSFKSKLNFYPLQLHQTCSLQRLTQWLPACQIQWSFYTLDNPLLLHVFSLIVLKDTITHDFPTVSPPTLSQSLAASSFQLLNIRIVQFILLEPLLLAIYTCNLNGPCGFKSLLIRMTLIPLTTVQISNLESKTYFKLPLTSYLRCLTASLTYIPNWAPDTPTNSTFLKFFPISMNRNSMFFQLLRPKTWMFSLHLSYPVR